MQTRTRVIFRWVFLCAAFFAVLVWVDESLVRAKTRINQEPQPAQPTLPDAGKARLAVFDASELVLTSTVFLPALSANYTETISGTAPISETNPLTETSTLTDTDYLTDTSGYTPVISKTASRSIFGVEAWNYWSAGVPISDTGSNWVRRNALLWHTVEPNLGERNWAAAAGTDAELAHLASLKLNTILIIRSTPTWAQKLAGSYCGPMKPEYFVAFGNFVRDAITRYSAPPYNVKYFELWNEPDAPIHTGDDVWGCWADKTDALYRGGGYYASMLKVVYPIAKATNPNAQIVVGGMLANCDPVKVPAGKDCSYSKYLEGILKNGGGAFFDGLSFHAYEYYYKVPGKWGNANWNNAYNIVGPSVINKARFFKKVLATYKVNNKFIMDTETALLCWDCTAAHQYELGKAWYIPEYLAAAMSEGLQTALWYSYEGWLGSGLVDANNVPQLGMQALRIARQKFGSTEFVGRVLPSDVGNVYGITGYKFKQGSRTIWLVRSSDSRNRAIRLSQLPTNVSDVLGNNIAASKTMTLSLKPIYIEWVE